MIGFIWKRGLFFRWNHVIQNQCLTAILTSRNIETIVKAAKKSVTQLTKNYSSSSSSSNPGKLACSPPLKRNGAKAIKDYMLNSQEQTAFNKHRTEIKQISALIILSTGLGLQEMKTCTQIMQESYFFANFEKVYDKLWNDTIIGKRVSNIPINYVNIGTGKAREVISGKQLRKKYSAMMSYTNNTLSPLWRK